MPAPIIESNSDAALCIGSDAPHRRFAGHLWMLATAPIEEIEDDDALSAFAETLADLLSRVNDRREVVLREALRIHSEPR